MNTFHMDGMREIVFDPESSHVIVHRNIETTDYATHWHAPMEILMPVENSYTAYVNNKEYQLQPYDILFVTPNVYHSYLAPKTGLRYFILIDVSVLKDIYGISQIISAINPCALFTETNAPQIHSQLKELFLAIADTYSHRSDLQVALSDKDDLKKASDRISLLEPVIYSKLIEMFTVIAQNLQKSPEKIPSASDWQQEHVNRFTMVCSYIDTHCMDNLSLDEIAQMSGFSKYHFSRLFKQFTNEPFYKYVNHKRIQYAMKLLVHQNMSITDIALAAGYSNTSTFIRMFKTFNACTPREYRDKYVHKQ